MLNSATSHWTWPRLSWRWFAFWRRNFMVWQKLAIPSMLGNLAEPAFYLLGLGYGLGALVESMEGMPYVAFLAAGTICYSTMISSSFEALYSAFTRMQVQRTWDATMNAPLELDDIVLAECLWAAAKSFLSGLAILLVVSLLGLVSSPMALFIIPVIALVGLAFAAMALIITALSPSYDFFMYYQTLVMTPMMLIGGVFFPVAQLPGVLQIVSQLLPLTHAVALVRPLMRGDVPIDIVIHVAVLLAYAAAGYWIALALLRKRLLK
jgi:lipooligosaccharide transport system permease protein